MAVVSTEFVLQGEGTSDAILETPEGSLAQADAPVTASQVLVPAIGVPSKSVVTEEDYFSDYYYRIWIWPLNVFIESADIGVPQDYSIWNAFPGTTNNTINVITESGTAGLIISPIVTDVYTPLEEKIETVIAPAGDILTTFTFDFTEGDGILTVVSREVEPDVVLDVEPLHGVTEQWVFNTDIMVSENATEQRVAIRQVPQRRLNYVGAVKSEADRKRHLNQLHAAMGREIYIPYWQYSCPISVEATIGSTELFCVPDQADLRDGDYILLTDSSTNNKYFLQASTILSDRINLTLPLEVNVGKRWLVILTLPHFIGSTPGISMQTLSGTLNVNGTESTPRSPLARPGATPSYETMEGLTILVDRPLPGAEEQFTINEELLQAPTGLNSLSSTWDHPLTHGRRSWVVKRTAMDYWRGFFDNIKGRQGAFLLPTWHADMTLFGTPSDAYTSFDISDEEYFSGYFQHNTHRRVQLDTQGGIFYRKVDTVTDNEDGTYTVNITPAMPSGSPNTQINKISLLELVRLDSDVVEWSHETTSSILSIRVQEIDE